MAKALKHAIKSALAHGPMAVSELYETLRSQGYKDASMKSALQRLTSDGTLSRSNLRFKGQDALVWHGPLEKGPKLVAKLAEKKFYGRQVLVNLFDSLRTEHPAVTRADVAKIAAIEIGRNPEPDWRDTDKLIEGLVEVGLLRPGSGGACIIFCSFALSA